MLVATQEMQPSIGIVESLRFMCLGRVARERNEQQQCVNEFDRKEVRKKEKSTMRQTPVERENKERLFMRPKAPSSWRTPGFVWTHPRDNNT